MFFFLFLVNNKFDSNFLSHLTKLGKFKMAACTSKWESCAGSTKNRIHSKVPTNPFVATNHIHPPQPSQVVFKL